MDEVLEFTKRRFSVDSHFVDGNCFYYSLILKARFSQGTITYDTLEGHFQLLIDNNYYDWLGVHQYEQSYIDKYIIEWDKFEEYDPLWYQRIVRDCIMYKQHDS